MRLGIAERRTLVGWARYVMGPQSANGDPRVAAPILLWGDPVAVEELAAASPFATQGFSCDFSWSEPAEKVPLEEATRVARDAADLFCADLPRHEFATTAVYHQRADGFDVHLAAAAMNLRLGLSFPFYTSSPFDEKLWWFWRRDQNLRNGWSDPEDEERRRLESPPPKYLSPTDRRTFREIDDHVCNAVDLGLVSSREALVEHLRRAGAAITSIKPHAITIQYSGRDFVFGGKKYSEQFFAPAAAGPEQRNLHRGAVDSDRAEDHDYAARIADLRRRRAERFARRFRAGRWRVAGPDPRSADVRDHGIHQSPAFGLTAAGADVRHCADQPSREPAVAEFIPVALGDCSARGLHRSGDQTDALVIFGRNYEKLGRLLYALCECLLRLGRALAAIVERGQSHRRDADLALGAARKRRGALCRMGQAGWQVGDDNLRSAYARGTAELHVGSQAKVGPGARDPRAFEQAVRRFGAAVDATVATAVAKAAAAADLGAAADSAGHSADLANHDSYAPPVSPTLSVRPSSKPVSTATDTIPTRGDGVAAPCMNTPPRLERIKLGWN